MTDKWETIIAERRVASVNLTERHSGVDPCPQCGAIDPAYKLQCIHRFDDRFGNDRACRIEKEG
jgi:hypothetical protein